MIGGAYIRQKVIGLAHLRLPDFVIGDEEDPYLFRWYLIPRNPIFNIYLHCFLKSDDSRALHDHMYANVSWLLDGCYVEHTIADGGIHRHKFHREGDVVFRLSGKKAHRIELIGQRCWTLFITGPRYREWGFHCPTKGWVHWRDYTDANNAGQIGKGCGG